MILSGKGQAVLHELGVYDRVVQCSAPSNYRQEWTPERPQGKRTVYTNDTQNPTPQVPSHTASTGGLAPPSTHVGRVYAPEIRGGPPPCSHP